jgi:formylglycine-generating enzyme required for sulfatase activity
MVLVPGGEFLMGNDGGSDASPAHKVSVESFFMDRYEMTQEIYERLMGENPSRRKGPTAPVERVRWLDAIKFCNARSVEEGLEPCYNIETRECHFDRDGYRLPTEAEWEYACRAGSAGDYYFGNDAGKLSAYGWFKPIARKPRPVGQKRPNDFGVYDMAGNVWEWCTDWYQVDYYAESPSTNPPGPAAGEKKVLRGGAFSTTAGSCCSWTRYCDEPGFTDACVASDDYGFRCVRRVIPD